MQRWIVLTTALLIVGASGAQDLPKPAVADIVKDRFVPAPYDRQRILGPLGERMRVNLEGRLLHADEAAMLAGFRNRPGNQPWIGEHAGKFLDAAANTWAYSRDQRLRTMMDRVAHGLIATQLPDGYLGTYTADGRWTGWDVWVHKYDLIGLLRYYQVTGDTAALAASRKIGDLLAGTFGDAPGQRNLIEAGEHAGMAATSVLEPICMLYRYTGEHRYLDFARYIVRSYNHPGGPRIVDSLLETGSVFKTANAKAYEMMSNLVGLVDLYRLTGDDTYLKPAVVAWKDIVARRLYITGTTSAGEYFHEDFVLPAEQSSHVGEGCATVTWLQLNWQLLRIGGEPRYAEELERTVYNQLLAAQDPHNGNICYFTPLVGHKNPTPGINCCVSSEPRGISLIPQLVWGAREGGVSINFYVPGEATVRVAQTLDVNLKAETLFPLTGAFTLVVRPSHTARFPLFLRVPGWSSRFVASVHGAAIAGEPGQFLKIDRTWQAGDTIQVRMDLPLRVLPGGNSYPDSVALQRGPQVLALEARLNPRVPELQRAAPASIKADEIRLEEVKASSGYAKAYSINGIYDGRPQPLTLVPFADAVEYRVWLIRPPYRSGDNPVRGR